MIHSDLKRSCFAYRISARCFPFVYRGAAPAPEAGPTESPKKAAAEGAPDAARVEAQDNKARDRGRLMIEAGYRLPSTTKTETREAVTRGGEVTARLMLSDPNKPYVAFVFPLSVKYESSVTYSGTSAPDMLAGTTTFLAGVGLEGGVPLGRYVALYAGAGLAGGVEINKRQEVTPTQSLGSSTEISPTPALFATGGLRINPTANLHAFVSVRPTVSMVGGSGLGGPVVGLGGTF